MSAPEPDWLRLQKKIFTRYVAQKLRQAGNKTEVKNIIEDLRGTNLLIEFAEVLSSKPFTGKKPAPATAKIQQMNSASVGLKFIKESCGVNTQTSPENIVDGNEKLILGMIFQIIMKFMKIEDEEGNVGGDVKEALMLWLKNRTAGYSGCNINDFTKSFHNGLPFCALIHKMRPRLINYDSLSPNSKISNIQTALDLGEKYCNVPKYIEASDIEKMDDVGMIVYLTDWYYGIALLQKQDTAARRIGKLIVLTELHDSMRANYSSQAKSLVDWANSTISKLNERKFENSVEGVQKQINEFNAYKTNEKSQKLGALLDAHFLFDDLAVRLAHNKRPKFAPAAGYSPEDLEKKMSDIDNAELERSKALQAELARQIEIVNDGICKQFADAVKVFQDWLAKKKSAVTGDKSSPLENQLSALDAATSGLDGQFNNVIADVTKHAKRIQERNITNNKFTPITAADCESAFKQLLMVSEKKRALLKQQIEDSKKSGLTDEQLQEIKDNFNYFDKNKSNNIDRRELRQVLQSLGQETTAKDLDTVLQTYAGGRKNLTFDEFKSFMMKILGDNDSKEEIITSFKLISLDKDSIRLDQLTSLINDLSWKQKHVDYLKKEMKPKDDGLNYESWVGEVFAR